MGIRHVIQIELYIYADMMEGGTGGPPTSDGFRAPVGGPPGTMQDLGFLWYEDIVEDLVV